MLAAVALAAVAVPSVFRLGWQRCSASEPPFAQRVLRLAAPSGGVLLLAVAVSLPGSPAWALAFLWFAIVVGEGAWWVFGLLSSRLRRAAHEARDVLHVAPREAAAPAFRGPSETMDELPVDVSQQLTRRSDGQSESVYGMLRCSFEPGERSRNLHLAFCPPLPANPNLAVHQVHGPAVTIKTAQVESFGARLELRLASRPVNDESVVVRFEALAPRDDVTQGGD